MTYFGNKQPNPNLEAVDDNAIVGGKWSGRAEVSGRRRRRRLPASWSSSSVVGRSK